MFAVGVESNGMIPVGMESNGMIPVGVWYSLPFLQERLHSSEREGQSQEATLACCVPSDFVGLAQIVFLVSVSEYLGFRIRATRKCFYS
jgi:hypothetical protein